MKKAAGSWPAAFLFFLFKPVQKEWMHRVCQRQEQPGDQKRGCGRGTLGRAETDEGRVLHRYQNIACGVYSHARQRRGGGVSPEAGKKRAVCAPHGHRQRLPVKDICGPDELKNKRREHKRDA